MSQFKPVLAYPNRASAYFLGRIAIQKKILAQVHAVLPEKLADRVPACVVAKRKLLIYTESAAWASKIRFYSRAIQNAVNDKTDASIDMIQIRLLMPLQTASSSQQKPVRIPSAKIIDALQHSAADRPLDRLSDALLNLGTTLKRLSGRN